MSSMNMEEFYQALAQLAEEVKARGLRGECYAHVNWFGDAVRITVTAREPSDANGSWSSERHFDGQPSEVGTLIADARAWIYALPSEEDRAVEVLLRKLNEIADALPKGGSEIAGAAWSEIYDMLKAKAARIAKNGLPSPARVTNFDELRV